MTRRVLLGLVLAALAATPAEAKRPGRFQAEAERLLEEAGSSFDQRNPAHRRLLQARSIGQLHELVRGLVAAEAGPEWTPAELGDEVVIAWYDPTVADARTVVDDELVTLIGGANVLAGAFHLTTSAGAGYPGLVQKNGFDYVSFAGDRALSTGSEPLLDDELTPPFTVYLTAYSDDDTATTVVFSLCDTTVSNQQIEIRMAGTSLGDPAAIYVRNASGVTQVTTTSGFAEGTVHLLCARVYSDTDIEIKIDGNEATIGRVDTITTYPTLSNNYRLALGGEVDASPGAYHLGGEGPALVVMGDPDAATEALIEGYFSRRGWTAP